MRALAWVERLGMTRTALDRLKPIPRRPIRIQPAKVTVDPEGNDLVIACELPVDAHMSVLIQELTHMTPGASAP